VLRTLAFLLILASCAPTPVRTAPFRVRPDAVTAGDLRGPFTGRVVDLSGGAPVAGALVYAAWTFETGAGLPQPGGFREAVASTDADGKYVVPALSDAPAAAHLTDFVLVIYKRGYVAYRSDRRFADLGPRLDFAQLHNEVQLERWREDYSHARHLRYVGGGAAVAALTRWEAEDAIAELSGERTGPGEIIPNLGNGPYVVAAQLLTDTDIKAQTKYEGSFETGPLGDEPDNPGYSSQHYKALGFPETYDLALRVWRSDAGGAQERYDELIGSLQAPDLTDEIASKSLRAVEGDIRGVAFLDGPRGLVVLLTCGQSQCKSMDDAVALAKKIDERIRKLWPLKSEEP
jgi:hypothetical protein